MEYVLGIDGGGTSTTCLLADGQGNLLAQVAAPASNHRKADLRDAREALLAGIKAVAARANLACEHPLRVAAVCAGLAGVDTEGDAAVLGALISELVKTDHLLVFNDGEIALAGALEDQPGLLVISGTGSIVWATAPDGRRVRVGGWDYILSDEGSGYCIGSLVLRAVAAAHDGRSRPTVLTDLVLDVFHSQDFNHLLDVIYHEEMTPQRIASLAPLADMAAQKQDAVALAVLAEAARELAELAAAAVRLADLNHFRFPVVPAGGVLLAKGAFAVKFRETMVAKVPNSYFVQPRHTPAEGAILLAVKALATSRAARRGQ